MTRIELVKRLQEILKAAESDVPEEEIAQAIQELETNWCSSVEERTLIRTAYSIWRSNEG